MTTIAVMIYGIAALLIAAAYICSQRQRATLKAHIKEDHQ